jgi:DNA replication protein DnaC
MNIRQRVESQSNQLKLSALWLALSQQLDSPKFDEMEFLERLEGLLDCQIIEMNNKRIAILQKQAHLRWPAAMLSDVDYSLQKSLKKPVINRLAELGWITSKRHLIITGPTGTGKTHLACAFANKAILTKIPVGFYRYNELMLQLLAASKAGELPQLRRKLNRLQLLVIDDWGVSPLSTEQRHLLFELIESRDRASSLIITSQYAIEDWYDAFQDPTIADSVLDRIVHSAHQIEIKGKSIREIYGVKGGKSA